MSKPILLRVIIFYVTVPAVKENSVVTGPAATEDKARQLKDGSHTL